MMTEQETIRNLRLAYNGADMYSPAAGYMHQTLRSIIKRLFMF